MLPTLIYYSLLPSAAFVVFLIFYYVTWLSWELFTNN